MKLSLTLLVFLCAVGLAARLKKAKVGPMSVAEKEIVVESVQNFDKDGNFHIEADKLVGEVEKQARVFQVEIINEIADFMSWVLDKLEGNGEGLDKESREELKKIKEGAPKGFIHGLKDFFSFMLDEIEEIVYHVSTEVMGKEVAKGIMEVMLKEAIEEAANEIEQDVTRALMKKFGFKGSETQEEINKIIHEKLTHFAKKEWDGVTDHMIEVSKSAGEAIAREVGPQVAQEIAKRGPRKH